MRLFNFNQNCIEKSYLFFVAGIPAFLLDNKVQNVIFLLKKVGLFLARLSKALKGKLKPLVRRSKIGISIFIVEF
jgi:hypothetical protein